MSNEHYDIIIIGTGAGGGTMAHRLATTGKKILILERGDFLPRERENWSTEAVFMPSVGAVNPSLTIIANALRVADHLKREVL